MPGHAADADTIDPVFLTCATVTLCPTLSVKSNRSQLTRVLRARNRVCFDVMYMNYLTRIIYNATDKTRCRGYIFPVVKNVPIDVSAHAQ